MSMVVEISGNGNELGPSKGLKDMMASISSKVSDSNVANIIKNTVCSGILQNDISIGFTNNWSGNVYKGIMDSLTTIGKNSKVDIGMDVVVGKGNISLGANAIKGIYDFGSTLTNYGGMSVVGAGAGTTKIYGGSDISSFSIEMKWYTPMDESYKSAMFALMLLGFPSFRNPVTNSNAASNNNGIVQKAIGMLGSIGEIFTGTLDTLSTLLSYNPPTVKVTVKSYNGNNYEKIFNIYPLIINAVNFRFSRETCNGIPIVITADVTFSFYQVLGNNGYVSENGSGDSFILGGVPLMGNIAEQVKKYGNG